MTACYTEIDSPLGPLLLAADAAGLRQILFLNGRHPARPESSWREDRAPLSETIHQLQAYFAGELETFDLPPLRHSVWRDGFLRRAGGPNRKSQSFPSRRPRQWLQPDPNRDPLPSRHRQ